MVSFSSHFWFFISFSHKIVSLVLSSFSSKDLYNPCFMVLVMQGYTECIFLSSVVFSLWFFYFSFSSKHSIEIEATAFSFLKGFHVFIQLSSYNCHWCKCLLFCILVVCTKSSSISTQILHRYKNKRYAFYSTYNCCRLYRNAGNEYFFWFRIIYFKMKMSLISY